LSEKLLKILLKNDQKLRKKLEKNDEKRAEIFVKKMLKLKALKKP
jgi:hypothetical protein